MNRLNEALLSADYAGFLEDFLNTIDNLPSEIQHIFSELKAKDIEYAELKDRIHAQDISLRKLIRSTTSETYSDPSSTTTASTTVPLSTPNAENSNSATSNDTPSKTNTSQPATAAPASTTNTFSSSASPKKSSSSPQKTPATPLSSSAIPVTTTTISNSSTSQPGAPPIHLDMSDAVNILTDEQRTLFRDVKHEFSVALALNEEKIRFADRALAMVDRHMRRLTTDLTKIAEHEGFYVPPITSSTSHLNLTYTPKSLTPSSSSSSSNHLLRTPVSAIGGGPRVSGVSSSVGSLASNRGLGNNIVVGGGHNVSTPSGVGIAVAGSGGGAAAVLGGSNGLVPSVSLPSLSSSNPTTNAATVAAAGGIHLNDKLGISTGGGSGGGGTLSNTPTITTTAAAAAAAAGVGGASVTTSTTTSTTAVGGGITTAAGSSNLGHVGTIPLSSGQGERSTVAALAAGVSGGGGGATTAMTNVALLSGGSTGSLAADETVNGMHSPAIRSNRPPSRKHPRNMKRKSSTSMMSSEEVGAGPPVDTDDTNRYCVCRQVSFGNMIACDGEDCPYEWFHYACVNLTESPTGLWYCPNCSQTQKRKRK